MADPAAASDRPRSPGPPPRSFFARGPLGVGAEPPVPGPRLRRAALWSAGGALVVLGALWLQNLLDPPPLRSGWLTIVILVFPFVFFPFAITILVIGSWQRQGFWAVVGSPPPWFSIVWRVAVLAGLALLSVASFPAGGGGPSGQPIAERGAYYVDNHGVRTEITEETYLELSSAWSRGFSAVPLLFAGISVLALSAPWGRPPPPTPEGP